MAFLAERHMTPEALQMWQKLLSENPIDPKMKRWCGNSFADGLVDGSTWPDDIRAKQKNGHWHYIDIPRAAKKGDLQPFCGSESCVTEALAKQIAILKDQTADAALRADALRYVVHFVGDLHQPLHAVDNNDHGGNCVAVQYFRRKPRLNKQHPETDDYTPNLHGVWDTQIVERDMEVGDPDRFAEELNETFAAQIAGWQKAGVRIDDWAWESHDSANRTVYGELPVKVEIEAPKTIASCADDNEIGKRMFEKHIVLGNAYQQVAEKLAEERLAQAGVRLAMILNEAAAANASK